MATQQEVNAWIAANPNATPVEILNAANAAGVTTNQLAEGYGISPAEVGRIAAQTYQASGVSPGQQVTTNYQPAQSGLLTSQTNALYSSSMTPEQITAQRQRTYASGTGGGEQAAALAQLPIETQKLFIDFATLSSMKSRAENESSLVGAQIGARQFREAGGQAALDALQRQIQSDPATAQIHADLTARYGRTSFGDAFMREIAPILTNAALIYGAGAGINALAGAGATGGAAGGFTSAGITPEAAAMALGETVPTAGGFLSAADIAALGGGAVGAAGAGLSGLGTGISAADLASAMTIPSGTASTVGGAALTAEQLAALNAGGTISAGQVLNSAGQVVGGAIPGLGAIGGGATTSGGLFGTGITGTQAASTGLGLLGSYLGGQSATDAAQISANAQIEAARIAADAAKFRPVGVTTRFGQSQFGYDDQGRLTTAGYTLSPELRAQQDTLMGLSGQALNQLQNVGTTTAPIGQGAQTLFGLGQGYLATTPQEQAAKYMAEQQALLAPSREREMAALQARLQATGRGGLAIGGTSTGMTASNPELEALYNARRMQDLQLASQATQGGQQYATFGAGLLGTGSDLLKSMYGTQVSAYQPYQTALGGATQIEQLGMQPLQIGSELGSATTAASAAAGRATQQGMLGAAQTMQPANAYSPWGALLTGAGQAIGQYGQQPAQTTTFTPQANYWSI